MKRLNLKKQQQNNNIKSKRDLLKNVNSLQKINYLLEIDVLQQLYCYKID